MSHSNEFIRKILITESTGEQGVCVCVLPVQGIPLFLFKPHT